MQTDKNYTSNLRNDHMTWYTTHRVAMPTEEKALINQWRLQVLAGNQGLLSIFCTFCHASICFKPFLRTYSLFGQTVLG